MSAENSVVYLRNAYHFPTKWQGVVFHSYAWVPSSAIAATLGCDEETVEKAAEELGLPREKFDPIRLKKSYQTVLRANFHLLPKPQLLTLLGLGEEEFDKLWYEEDFLNVKMGESGAEGPVVYAPLTAEQKKRTEHIARLVRENMVPQKRGYFDFYPERRIYDNSSAVIKCPECAAEYAEFVRRYYDLSFLKGRELVLCEEKRGDESFSLEADGKTVTVSGGPEGLLRGMQYAAENGVGTFSDNIRPAFSDRIIYDYDASCSDFATAGEPPEVYLRELAFKQVNGIFLHGLLRTLAPFPFDETLSNGFEKRIEYLNRYIAAARKYGIRVYLYLNEPRNMPLKFFGGKDDILGAVGGGELGAFCTSVPKVRKWMSDAVSFLVSRLDKNFGGFITITASENLTNCKSVRGNLKECERCKDKSKGYLYADVNNMIYRATVSANPDARLIAWLWEQDTETALETISHLDKGIVVANVSEDRQPVRVAGAEAEVIDYSMSNPGPSEKSLTLFKAAHEAGHSVIAKVQVNNTWECSSVPYIPVFDTVRGHIERLKDCADGLLLSWTLGGYPSPNLDIVKQIAFGGEDFCARRYGKNAGTVREACSAFSEAFREFPFCLDFLYLGPQNYGCVDLFFPKPTGMRATMIGFPQDDIESWKGCYDKFALTDQLGKLSERWGEGLEKLKPVAAEVPDLYAAAEGAYIQLRSSFNQARYVLLRDGKDKKVLSDIIDEEFALTRRMLALQARDKRIGFEASNHYYFNRNTLLEKLINLDFIKNT